jgi:four helix bundle protein
VRRRDGEWEKRGTHQRQNGKNDREMGDSMKKAISDYRELDVYKMAMECAMRIFELTKKFPSEEKYGLIGQIRRSSRSVCANIAEAWRKRRYKAAFVSKLSDSETEAAETQVWLEFSSRCEFISESEYSALDSEYNRIIGKIVRMMDNPHPWLIKMREKRKNA